MSASEGLTRASLAAMVDHTLLRPEATREELRRVVAEGASNGCASVCVQPNMVPTAVEVAGARVPVCAVVGFPHGASPSVVTAHEAAAVVAHGAAEVDMVADLAALAEGDMLAVSADIATVRAAVPSVVLKVILESALWSPATLRAACDAALDAGADFVKTSTGFHPSGGATVEAVATMSAEVAGRAGVKASGGIRSLAAVRAMVDAGATRLGLSGTVSILDELEVAGSAGAE